MTAPLPLSEGLDPPLPPDYKLIGRDGDNLFLDSLRSEPGSLILHCDNGKLQ